jgi:predicted peptidase
MSDNGKNEEKWVLHFRDDQLDLISDAMAYIARRCDERIGQINYVAFDQFTSKLIKARAEEIAKHIEDVR